jgi:hypothetical protein
VVVNVDRELSIESLDPGASDIRTLDNEDGVVIRVQCLKVANIIRTWKACISWRYITVDNDLSLFTERLEQPEKAQ